jgi:DNA-binding CsgD family transcriptional regulator/tetratricopeptide (TPR) repeat protein
MGRRTSSPAFVGRAGELEALDAAVRRAVAGKGAAVLIAGEAGVGKSRLVAELERRALDAGAMVLVGECIDLADTELPYAPIVGALRPVFRERADDDELVEPGREELARLWPELGTVSGLQAPGGTPGSGQARLFELLLGLLTRLAREQPLVLVVEDLHWADRSTRDLLVFLVRNVRREPLLLVATYRTEELHRGHALRPFVAELERSGRGRRLDLARFSRGEMTTLITDLLEAPPERPLLDSVFARSEGNPFFAQELVAATGDGDLPDSLRDALLLRVEPLAPVTRQVLGVASVAGRRVGHRLLAAVAGSSEAELDAALREAVAWNVLVTDADGASYAFRHALLREAVYHDLLAGERLRTHAALARALADRPELAGDGVGVAAELAHHWLAAGELGSAFSASVRAGSDAANAHAPAEALRQFERSLDLWDRVGHAAESASLDRAELLHRAAEAALAAGHDERAVELGRLAIAQADAELDPKRASFLTTRLGRYLWWAGDGDAALIAYHEALSYVASGTPPVERARALAGEGQALMLLGRYAEARERLEEALPIARRVGDRLTEANILNSLGPTEASDTALEQLARALRIADELGATEEIGRAYVNTTHVLDELGRIDEAVVYAGECRDRMRRWGIEREAGNFLASDTADRLRRLGRWDESEHLGREVLDQPVTGVTALVTHHAVGALAAERGDFAEAERHLLRAAEIGRRDRSPQRGGPTFAALGALRLWEGRLDDAREVLAEGLHAVADAVFAGGVFDFAGIYSTAARAEVDRGDRARALGEHETVACAEAQARQVLGAFDATLRAFGTRAAPPEALAHRALTAAEVTRTSGRSDATAWADAAQSWRLLGEPFPAAYADFRRAEALALGGARTAEVAGPLRAAHATAVGLGARPLRKEVEALARRARVQLHGEAAEQGGPAAQLGLTDREVEVLALLADGRTNRQIGNELFISAKTASAHASRIFAKLGVANRAEAAGVAHRLGLAPDRAP